MDAYPRYRSQHEALKYLPKEIRAEVLIALDDYAFDGTMPEGISGTAMAMFTLLKVSIDNSKARAETGAKGGRAKAEKMANAEQDSSEDLANVKQSSSEGLANAKQSSSKSLLNEKLETRNKKLESTNNTITTKPVARECDFDEIWKLYPRKEGRARALDAYKRAIHNGVTKETIMDGVKRYADWVRLKQTEQRYIKQGSTWFSGKCWEDILDFSSAPQGFDQRTDPMDGILMDL